MKTTTEQTYSGRVTVTITDNLGITYTAVSSTRIEWRIEGQLVKRERIPQAIRQVAIEAGGIYQDETIVGEEGRA